MFFLNNFKETEKHQAKLLGRSKARSVDHADLSLATVKSLILSIERDIGHQIHMHAAHTTIYNAWFTSLTWQLVRNCDSMMRISWKKTSTNEQTFVSFNKFFSIQFVAFNAIDWNLSALWELKCVLFSMPSHTMSLSLSERSHTETHIHIDGQKPVSKSSGSFDIQAQVLCFEYQIM